MSQVSCGEFPVGAPAIHRGLEALEGVPERRGGGGGARQHLGQARAEQPHAHRRALASDRITQIQDEQGGFRAGRSLRVYGVRTRREFLALRRREMARPG
jgi:hypothetical protein